MRADLPEGSVTFLFADDEGTERGRERLGLAPDQDEMATSGRALAPKRPWLDGVDLKSAWARGSDLDLSQALQLSLGTSSP